MGGTAAPKDRPANITAAKAVRNCARLEGLLDIIFLLISRGGRQGRDGRGDGPRLWKGAW